MTYYKINGALLDLILRVLSNLPYAQVADLIHKIQSDVKLLDEKK